MSYTEAAYSLRKYRRIATQRVLVTGAEGSIGQIVVPMLRERDDTLVFPTDLGYENHLDVTDRRDLQHWVLTARPTHILHLAGVKHAPEGEVDPAETVRVNTLGTQNVVELAGRAKVVLASTCKAADPETVYGASKLIAERMVLNAGGVVIRFFNVRETDGNVFRLWESIPETEPLPVTDCWRYFISTDQAATLALAGLDLPTGRYTVDPGERQHMSWEARRLYPTRKVTKIDRRRGDRYREPLCAAAEHTEEHGQFLRIVGQHDPQ